MRSWTFPTFGLGLSLWTSVLCALPFGLAWALTVSVLRLAQPFPRLCFWGSRNCFNCLSCCGLRRTTWASISTSLKLMDFRIRSLSAFAARSLAFWLCVVVFQPVSSFMWSDLDSQFRCEQQSAGWNFQPHSFDAQKNCSLSMFWAPGGTSRVVSFSFSLCSMRTYTWFQVVFDATLGYPGEGHHNQGMTFVSANIGSIMTDQTWKTWNADVVCLQETRVGRNNFRSASKIFQNVQQQDHQDSLWGHFDRRWVRFHPTL